MKRLYYCVAYYQSWVFFAFFGLLLNVICAPMLLLPRRERLVPFVRSMIRFLFQWWVRWFGLSKMLRIRWVGVPEEGLPSGVIYVANHPTLVDATFLLSRLPRAFCLFKPKLMRNPAIGPAAIMASYVAGETAVDVLRQSVEKVSAGETMLIFPEGTRTTPGRAVEPLRPGFAVIAQRASVPVQLLVIRASRGLVPRGRAWWRPPEELPAWVEIRLDRRWEPAPNLDMQTLREEVERRLREVLEPEAVSAVAVKTELS